MGQPVDVPPFARRIISLVPSQTELLFDLGLGDRIVGVTRFCIHPEGAVGAKERIGGTKDFDLEKIETLVPDLILGNKEENYPEGIAALREKFPVWMSDIYTLHDAYQMMLAIGQMTATELTARDLVAEIQNEFAALVRHRALPQGLTAAYLIWRKPYMVAADHTFIDHMLGALGVQNVFAELSRYPAVSAAQLSEARPDLVFLSSEPYSFTERHMAEFQQLCPAARVMIVDGEMFSWYGSRLRQAAEYLSLLRDSILNTLT
ncbi:MAG: ABC transporter substrate-binding protein [Bacteroidetes bacterium]|nr:ABC transporter substrate-binding protein [Bacteroidota bacterium]